MLSTILLIIVVAVIAVLIYAATRPDAFKIERTTRISASPDKVFPLIADLHAFNTWNPFAKSDPTTRIYRGAQSGVGAAYDWAGGKSGAGSMVVTEATSPSRVAMDLHFTKPMVANKKVLFTLTPAGNAVDVSWAMTGTSPFLHKLFGLFFSMEKMVGGEFVKGLAGLKAMAEH